MRRKLIQRKYQISPCFSTQLPSRRLAIAVAIFSCIIVAGRTDPYKSHLPLKFATRLGRTRIIRIIQTQTQPRLALPCLAMRKNDDPQLALRLFRVGLDLALAVRGLTRNRWNCRPAG